MSDWSWELAGAGRGGSDKECDAAPAAAGDLCGCANLPIGGECVYCGGWWLERLCIWILGWRKLRLLFLPWPVVAATAVGASAAPATAGGLCRLWLPTSKFAVAYLDF